MCDVDEGDIRNKGNRKTPKLLLEFYLNKSIEYGQKMKTIVIVGRPNVGKSSLFNRLTKTRDAIVADFPGLTRDRHYGKLEIQDSQFLLVDTGGFEPKNKEANCSRNGSSNKTSYR